jgi:RNA polymerase sigma-70 factor (ECF subfamily)
METGLSRQWKDRERTVPSPKLRPRSAAAGKEPVGSIKESPALVSALRSGDEDAFEKLVRENSQHLFAVARRMLGNEEDARDAVQDAFLAAFRSMGRFRGDSRISTWLHRIVVNAALGRLRRRRRKPEESIEELLRNGKEGRGRALTIPPDPSEPADGALIRGEIRCRLRESFHRLPHTYRTVMRLRDIEGLGVEETAKVLGTTPNATKIRLHRARKALRNILAGERHRALGTEGSVDALQIKEVS